MPKRQQICLTKPKYARAHKRVNPARPIWLFRHAALPACIREVGVTPI
jgi:hypothetical protein